MRLTPDTAYALSIVVVADAVRFFINDRLMSVHKDDLPAADTQLGFIVSASRIHTASSAAQIEFSRLTVSY